MKKKGYIGWIVSHLVRGKRKLVFGSLSIKRLSAVDGYLESECDFFERWEERRDDPKVRARVHKVTEIKTIK